MGDEPVAKIKTSAFNRCGPSAVLTSTSCGEIILAVPLRRRTCALLAACSMRCRNVESSVFFWSTSCWMGEKSLAARCD